MTPTLILAGVALAASACGDLSQDSSEFGADAPPSGGIDSVLARAEDAYWRWEIEEAQDGFQAVLDTARATADVSNEARALTWLGLVSYRRDEYAQARRLGEAALELKLGGGLQDQLFQSYNALGLLAFSESRYLDALEMYERARELAEIAADTLSLTKVWTNLGLAYTELGEFGRARELFLRAHPAAHRLGEPLIEGRVLTNLGMLAVRTGDPPAALRYLAEARPALREAEDVLGELNMLGQLGTAYAAIGEPGRAIAHLDSALAAARREERPQEVASNLEHLAALYGEAGDHRRALGLLAEAIAIDRELGMNDELGTNLRNVAGIHAELGNLGMAEAAAMEALEAHADVGARLQVLFDRLVLAELTHRSGRSAEASTHLAEAGLLADRMDAAAPRAAVALTAARVADADERSPDVLGTLARAEADLRLAGSDREWEVQLLVARAHAREGRLEEAASAGHRALEAAERIRGAYGSAILRTSYLADRESVYQELTDVLMELGRIEEAFQVADAARGRPLREHLATVRSDGAPTARELAEEERQILLRIQDLLVLMDEAAASAEDGAEDYAHELERLPERLERARAEYAAALVRGQERGAARAALAGDRETDPRAIRMALGPAEALVDYLVGPDGIWIFVATSDTIQAFRSYIPRGTLQTRIRVARELLARPGADPASVASVQAALGEVLLGPLLGSEVLRGRRLLILVPHAELAYVPFAALLNPETGRHLVEEYALLHLPTAGALPALRTRRAPRVDATTATAFGPFPEALAASGAELDAFARAWPGSRAVRGRRATERSVRDALSRDWIVHLATHGALNARSPLFSRIALAGGDLGTPGNDGRLEVHEIVELPVQSSLVFLSGCETSLGAAGVTGFDRGEDYATLSRAFLFAGAENVVATLWRVEDEAAGILARTFYERLASRTGEGPGRTEDLAVALALAEAQRSMLSDPAHRAPYYWAAYRLSGSGILGTGRGGAARERAPRNIEAPVRSRE